jgi:hypothetical protein
MAPDPALPPSDLHVADNAIQLSLDDAAHHPRSSATWGCSYERYDAQSSSASASTRRWGIYDLGIVGNVTESSDTTPSFSIVTGTGRLVNKRRNAGFTLSQLLPWGGIASTGFSLFRQESNSKDIPINPTYTGNLDFGYTQPLLRNLGLMATEYRIKLAQIDDSISREDLEVVVANTLQATENAYWNLAQARKEVEVANEALSLAQDLHHMNEVRVQVGTLAKLELVQSEVGIATRKEAIILAQAAQGNAEDALRQLLHVEEGSMWTLPIVPTTKPDTSALNIDLAHALDAAVAARPEVKSQTMILDRRSTDVAYLRNQTLPRLDLVTGYGYNGGNALVTRDASGNLIPVAGGVSDVLDQLRTHDLPGWSVGLQLAYPLQNRQARAAKAIAEVKPRPGQDADGPAPGGGAHGGAPRRPRRDHGLPGDRFGQRVDATRREEPRRRAQALRERALHELPGTRDPGRSHGGTLTAGRRGGRLPPLDRRVLPLDRHSARRGRRGIERPPARRAPQPFQLRHRGARRQVTGSLQPRRTPGSLRPGIDHDVG